MNRFRIQSNVSIKEGNKLFLGDVHLFNCNNEAVNLIENLIKKSSDNVYFTFTDALECLNRDSEFNIFEGGKKHYLLDTLDFLAKCGVVETDCSKMFEVADNDEAVNIIKRAITFSVCPHMDIR